MCNTLISVRRFPVLIAFIAVAVGFAVPASALLTCMGDQPNSAMAQMACCKSAKPECEHHSAQGLKCCKSGDHPEQQNIAKVSPVTNPFKIQTQAAGLVSTTDPTLPFFARQHSHPPVTLFAGTTSPPHLAFSTLLI
jgi:hypothetical protein